MVPVQQYVGHILFLSCTAKLPEYHHAANLDKISQIQFNFAICFADSLKS